MEVYEAVQSRRAVRAFADRPVPDDALLRVVSAAARAPSGGNLQPWHIYVVTGSALAELKARTLTRVAAGDAGDEREFEMYPGVLDDRYRARRDAAANARFTAMGVARDDPRARACAVAENWRCFGAPAALFCYIDRVMGPPQWADLGMYLQTVMLLLRAEGLHSCPQMAWSVYRTTVSTLLHVPPELVLFCGLSVGYEAPDACSAVHTERAPLAETVSFVD